MLKDSLKELRENRHLTKKQVALGVGITDRAYIAYEYGERDVSTDTLCKFADFYGVTTDYLLGREKPKEPTALDNLVKEFNLSELEKLVVQAYFLLDYKERQNLVETAEKIAKEKERLADEQHSENSIRKSTTYTCGELEDMKEAEKIETEDAG